jgi:hypothetical protein
VNPLPEFYEPVSEFEMWRDYREKRNRRAFYFLALLIILLIFASSLPSSDGPVFGTGNTQNTATGSAEPGAAGQDGEDGVDGINGANGEDGADGSPGPAGADGQDGADGAAGPQGPEGPQGPAGANGSSSPSIATPSGQAVVRVGTCDSDITVSMRSRLVSGVFYFKRITFSDIDVSCVGSTMDVYLLDASDDEIASYQGGVIPGGSSFSFEYSDFELAGVATDVLAYDIDSVAIEIAE